MSIAYQRGYTAGLRERHGKKYIRECPHEGHNPASMELQLQWRNGWLDALTGRRLPRIRKSLDPRRRTNWPRSDYARRRLEAIFHISIGGFSS